MSVVVCVNPSAVSRSISFSFQFEVFVLFGYIRNN